VCGACMDVHTPTSTVAKSPVFMRITTLWCAWEPRQMRGWAGWGIAVNARRQIVLLSIRLSKCHPECPTECKNSSMNISDGERRTRTLGPAARRPHVRFALHRVYFRLSAKNKVESSRL
jgi:hypothetical protein